MSIISKAVDWAQKTASDRTHGYDQANRWGPDYDCSSFVISAYKHAGVPLTATYTGNMKKDFLAHGFRDVTASVNLASGSGLLTGDVLLNERSHTALYVGYGKVAQASVNENGKVTGGKTGDQTGREIYIGYYYNYPWDCVLRYEEKNGASVPATADPPQKEDSAEAPYPGAVENEDYYVVKAGDTLWGIAERFLGDGTLYPLITQLNGVTANNLRPGMVILLHPENESDEESDSDYDNSSDEDEVEMPEGAYLMALRVLRPGDSGDTVRQTQRLLIATGYAMPKYGADGDYGAETTDAVKKFQKDNGLPLHGAVDKITMIRLMGN